MFDIHCPNHGSRVLLFSSDIEAVHNRDPPHLNSNASSSATGSRCSIRSTHRIWRDIGNPTCWLWPAPANICPSRPEGGIDERLYPQ